MLFDISSTSSSPNFVRCRKFSDIELVNLIFRIWHRLTETEATPLVSWSAHLASYWLLFHQFHSSLPYPFVIVRIHKRVFMFNLNIFETRRSCSRLSVIKQFPH